MSRVKKRKHKVNRKRFGLFLCLILLLCAGLVLLLHSCAGRNENKGGNTEDQSPAQTAEAGSTPSAIGSEPEDGPAEPEPEPEPVELHVSMRCAGDIMAHESQLKAAYDKASDSYDFTDVFSYVKPYISCADLPMANLETTFHDTPPYTGYPGFKSPDSLLDAALTMDLKLAFVANNHTFDSGLTGLKRDIELIRSKGVVASGGQLPGEDRFQIININGVNIGVVAYTYETQRYQGMRTVNGYALNADAVECINSFGYQETFESDLEAIKEQMRLCREAGADVILCYMHWGEEYQLSANGWQLRIGEYLANNGADFILASHPHTLQQIEKFEIEEEWGTKIVPCFYSMGNFVSNQRQETLKNRYTEQGMVACIDFTYVPDTGEIKDVEYGCIPTWVEKYTNKDGKLKYFVIPLVGDFENNPELVASGHVSRAQQALEDIKKLVGGEDLIWQE